MIDSIDFNRRGHVKRAFFAGPAGRVRKLCQVLGFNPAFRVPRGVRSARVEIGELDRIDRARMQAALDFWHSA